MGIATVKQYMSRCLQLCNGAELRSSGFNSQRLVSTAWSFATVHRLDEQLFAALR